MRVTEIRYERVVKISTGPGGFDNLKIAYTVLLEEEDNVEVAWEYARRMVESKLVLRGGDIPPLSQEDFVRTKTWHERNSDESQAESRRSSRR